MAQAASPLATWIVEFDASGVRAVEAALDLVLARVKTVDSALRGLAGTGDMERLAFLVQQVSREFASVFLPVIRAAQAALMEIVRWLRSLSGEGQALIRNIVLTAGAIRVMNAALAASPIYGFLTAFSVFVTVLDQMGNALRTIIGPLKFVFDFFAETGIGTFIIEVVALTAALYTMGAAAETAFSKWAFAAAMAGGATAGLAGALQALVASMGPGFLVVSSIALVLAGLHAFFRGKSDRNQLGAASGGAETLEHAWDRIQRAALGQDLQLAQLRQLEQIAANTGRALQLPNQMSLSLT